MKKTLVAITFALTFTVYAALVRRYTPVHTTLAVDSTSLPTTTPTPTATPVPTASPSATSTPTPTPTAASTPTPTPTPSPSGAYKNGVYTGSIEDVYYGNVQVRATISGGKLTAVDFLDHPSDRATSVRLNNQAMPLLRSEAITAQSAEVDVISGATLTSEGFARSLKNALAQAS